MGFFGFLVALLRLLLGLRRGEREALVALGAEEAVREPLLDPVRVSRMRPRADTLRVRPALRRDVHRRRLRGATLAVVEELAGLRHAADLDGTMTVARGTLADGDALCLVPPLECLDGSRVCRAPLCATRRVLCRQPLLDGDHLLAVDLPPGLAVLQAVEVLCRHGAEEALGLEVEGREFALHLWDAADALTVALVHCQGAAGITL